jgi:ABC-type multidrug transport system fused ATPase/permease subunit
VKYINSVLVSFSLYLTLVANFQFEQDTSGQLFTKTLSVIMRFFAKPSEGPSMSAAPLFDNNQFATFVFIFVSTVFLFIVCFRELKTVWCSGKNKKSAYLITMSAVILFFNLRLAIWNT